MLMRLTCDRSTCQALLGNLLARSCPCASSTGPAPWPHVNSNWPHAGSTWPSLAELGPILAHPGPILNHLGSSLAPLRLILPRFWLVLKQLPVIFDRLGQTCSVLAQLGLCDWVGKHWNQRAHPCHVFDHPPRAEKSSRFDSRPGYAPFKAGAERMSSRMYG